MYRLYGSNGLNGVAGMNLWRHVLRRGSHTCSRNLKLRLQSVVAGISTEQVLRAGTSAAWLTQEVQETLVVQTCAGGERQPQQVLSGLHFQDELAEVGVFEIGGEFLGAELYIQ
jgi:hypothetical protein